MVLAAAHAARIDEVATKTGATKNHAPGWIKHGAYVYRICTPDDADTLTSMEEGLAITSHLFDGAIEQIPIINGLIGDDHQGDFNWDGIWPYWNHVSFRAKDWDTLHGFMQARPRQVQHESLVPCEFDRCERRAEGLSRNAGVFQKTRGNQIDLPPRLESRDKETGHSSRPMCRKISPPTRTSRSRFLRS